MGLGEALTQRRVPAGTWLAFGVAVLALAGCLQALPEKNAPGLPSPSLAPASPPAAAGAEGEGIVVEDGVRRLAWVRLQDFHQGCPGLDCIPSIDEPVFQTPSQADAWLQPEDRVLSVSFNGLTRAYPTRVLDRHEIVNDVFLGEPVAVTYCPLCGTGLAFKRRVQGRILSFGVSGKLYNSDLVMYDRQTRSYWLQLAGIAAVGELAGTRLESVPLEVMLWKDWKQAFAQGEVLAPVFPLSVYTYPYGDYESSPAVYFPLLSEDHRLFPKAWVYGLAEEGGGAARAWPEEALKSAGGPVNDSVGETAVLAVTDPETGAVRFFQRQAQGRALTFYLKDGELYDRETGTRWDFLGRAVAGPLEGALLPRLNAVRGFWFAWAAFHPATTVFKAEN